MNSLKLGAAAAALAGVFAVPLAWAVSRTDMPGRGFTRMLVLATFITPPYLGAVGWILLAGPNAGWLNRVCMLVTGAEAGPFNIYSFTGLARRHRALFLPLHLRLHHGGARSGLVGDGGCREHPRRRAPAHHAAGHAAAGAAGDPGRPDHLLPRGDRAVRLAGA